jgi:FlaA1/EpsC-like NDP-sugar epimerase
MTLYSVNNCRLANDSVIPTPSHISYILLKEFSCQKRTTAYKQRIFWCARSTQLSYTVWYNISLGACVLCISFFVSFLSFLCLLFTILMWRTFEGAYRSDRDISAIVLIYNAMRFAKKFLKHNKNRRSYFVTFIFYRRWKISVY